MSDGTPSFGASRRQLLELLLRRRARRRQAAAGSPLAVGQRALWYIHRLAPQSHAYNVVFATKILSPLDVQAMASAWERLVRRHPCLRLRVEEGDDGALRQVICPAGEEPLASGPTGGAVPPGAVPLEFVDAEGFSEARLEQELDRIAEQPFDLESGPVARLGLLRRAEDDVALILVAHHIAVDFWSFGVLLDELHRLYPAELAHRNEGAPEPTLPPLPATYGEYVRWQRELLASPRGEELWAYWRDQLAGELPVLELPTDRPRPAVQTYRGASLTFPLDSELTAALRAFSRQRGLTPFVSLLAVLATLLMRLAGQHDVRVGSPMLGRSRPEFERVVGFFANMVVLRATPASELDFETFAAGLKDVVYGALEHQDLPFARLVERLQLPRDPSRGPLFDVAFSVESPRMDVHGISRLLLGEAGARTELAGLTMEALPLAQQEGQFDLMFHLLEIGDVIAGILPYNADLFDEATARRMAGWFTELARGAVAQPGAALGELTLLDAAERHQVTVGWNHAAADTPEAIEDLTVPQLVARVAASTPDAVALEMQLPEASGDTLEIRALARLTYRQLLARARRLAATLRRHGAGPETRVAVCAERGLDAVTAVLAVLEAGAAFVPLDPAYPAQRLRFMARDADARVILVEEALRSRLPELEGTWLSLEEELETVDSLASGESGEGELPAPLPGADVGPDALAYIMYTSGSTGRPKGVAVTHRSIVRLTQRDSFADLGPRQVFLLMAPLSFDASTLEIWAPLTRGGRLAVLPPGTPSLTDIGAALARHRVTTLWLTAGLFHRMVDEEIAALAPLAQLLSGGDVLSPPHVRKVLEAHPHLRVINGYGPTENTTFTCCWPMDEAAAVESPVPIGLPIAGTAVYIVDGRFAAQPPGVAGELLTGGHGLARGYVGRPSLTAERFVPNPFAGAGDVGGRLYRTGDLARWRRDGSVDFLGRVDTQVKIRGFRIEPGEIQSALAALPEVAEAVVTVRKIGATGKHLAAYVVPTAGATPDPKALRAALGESLPDHMVPRFVVLLEALPLNTNGKVDRKALPDPRQGALDAAADADLANLADEQSEAPAIAGQPVTRALGEIFRQVLELPRLDPDANFFDLGGHSLLLAQAHSRILKELGDGLAQPPTLVDLLHRPTLRSLAAHLAPEEHRRRSPAPSVGAGTTPAREASVAAGDAARGREIAVIGLAGRFPGAPDVDTLWRRLLAGDELLSTFAKDELETGGLAPEDPEDPLWVQRGGLLEDIDRFDAGFFGYSPREAEGLDPQQRLFLEVAWHALEDAGHGDPELFARRGLRVGVFAGTGASTYLRYQLLANPVAARSLGEYQLLLGNDKDFLATRVSYKFDLKGPAVVVQSACSTSLVAVHMAAESLAAGECDVAIAGGANVRLPQRAGYRYEQGMILSPDGHCRAFDADARGTVPGNGVAAVVLRPLASARAAGDPVRAVVKGSAINNDGSLKAGYTAPSVEGQAQVLADALTAAAVDPSTVGYIEAHGTGTELGDPIEVAALNQVFGNGSGQSFEAGSALLGSLKSNIGHLDAAAGIAGFVKAVLAVETGQVPPSLHFQSPNPKIDFAAGPFRVAAATTSFPIRGAAPRRAGVSSFGVGGTNAHVVLEQAPEQVPAQVMESGETQNQAASTSPHLLLVSGATEGALERNAAALAKHLEGRPGLNVGAVAHTLQSGRKTFAHRRFAVISASAEPAGGAAVAALVDPERYRQRHEERRERPVAFLFPGQGSQYPNMARGLYAAYPVVRAVVDRAAAVLREPLGLDLRSVLFPAPGHEEEAAARLAQTSLTQPVLFAVEYALAKLWMSWGLSPAAMIGHSIGEYVAATVAGVFTVDDGLRLVAERGRLIQALPAGDMLSVPLPVARVEELLVNHPQLSLAAANAPKLCVVSGPAEAVAVLSAQLDGGELPEGRVAARQLHTSHAFHSAMMDDALPAFRAAVAAVPRRAPRIPFVSNVSGRWIGADEAQDPEYWASHLRGAVRFTDGLATLVEEGDDPLLLEVGPGKTLSTLVRRAGLEVGDGTAAAPVRAVQCVRHPVAEDDDLEVMTAALGQVWMGGATVDWEAARGDASTPPRRLPLPGYRFEEDRYWIEASAEAAVGPVTSPSGLWRSSWRTALPPLPPFGEAGSRIVLVGEAGGLAAALTPRLQAAGLTVLRAALMSTPSAATSSVSSAAGLPAVDEGLDGWSRLFEYLSGTPDGLPSRWVYLGCAGPREGDPGDGLEERFTTARTLGVDRLQAFARAVAGASAESTPPLSLVVVTAGVEAVDGTETLLPERAPGAALAHTLPRELPGLAVRVVDLAPRVEKPAVEKPVVGKPVAGKPVAGKPAANEAWVEGPVVDAIARELVSMPQGASAATAAGTTEGAVDDDRVALRGGVRFLQTFEPVPAATSELSSGSTLTGAWLVTGGLGRIGSALAATLVAAGAEALALVVCQPLPEAGDDGLRARRFAALRELGVPVRAATVDLADAMALEAAVVRLETEVGPLRGVLHAAGESRLETLGPVAEVPREAFDAHFHAQVRGVVSLDRVLRRRSEPPALAVLGGSLFSRVGAAGLGPHAAAHAYAGLYATAGAAHLPWRGLAWEAWRPESGGEGTWRGADLDAALDPAAAGRALMATLALDPTTAAAIPQLWVSGQQPRERLRPVKKASEATATTRRRTVDTPYLEPSTETEIAVATVWEELLGVAPVGSRDDFFDLGGHSLMGTRVLSRLQQTYAVELPLSVLFRHSTLAALAAEVDRQCGARGGAVDGDEASGPSNITPAGPAAISSSGGVDLDLGGLSDDDVTALLEGMMEDQLEESTP